MNSEFVGYEDHPVDHIEPPEDGVELTEMMILHSALNWITAARDPQLEAWGIAFAVGCPICEGQNMTTVGETMGVGRATVCRIANKFRRSMGLPRSPYMRGPEARSASRRARLEVLKGGELL